MSKFTQQLSNVIALSFCIASSALAAPSLHASSMSSLIDANNDSVPNPGEQIQYLITVSNTSGEDANNVALASSIDPNVTVLSTAKIASSGAFDDCYGTATNTSVSVNAASGVLANDLTGLTIIPGTVTSKQGVVVTINGDGSFSYVPPTGYSGMDSFVYSALDSGGENNQGIVSFAILAGLSGSQVGDLQNITGTTDSTGVITALQADLNTIGSGLVGVGTSATTAVLKTDVDTVRIALDNKTSASASAGITAVANLVASSPSGNLKTDVSNVISSVDGTTVGSLSGKVSTVSDLVISSSSKTNLKTDITAAETSLGGTGTLTARINSLGSSIATTPTNLTSDLSTALGNLGGTGSLIARSAAIKTALGTSDAATQLSSATTLAGGSGTLNSRLSGISGKILTAPSGDITSDLGTAQGLLVTTPGSTIQADIETVNSLANGNGSGSTTQARLNAIDNKTLTTPTGNILDDLDSARGHLVATPGSTLQVDAGTLNTALNGTPGGSTTEARITAVIGSVKNGATQASTAVSDVATKLGTDASLTANTDIYRILTDANSGSTSGILAKINSTQPASILSGIESVGTIVNGSLSLTGASTNNLVAKLGDPSGNTTIKNLSAVIGGTATTSLHTQLGLTTQSDSLTDQIKNGSASIQAAIDSVDTSLGGSGDIYSRITSANNGVLTTPTGVIGTDLATLQSLIVTTPGATAQADVQTVDGLLNGTATGSTVQGRIGAPQVNGVGSNLAALLGGSGSTLASKLGDPGAHFASVSAMIGGSASNIIGQLGNASGTTSLADKIEPSAASVQAAISSATSSIKNGATVTSTAISDVSAKLGSDASLTTNSDLYRELTDANSASMSGILAKINSTQPASLLAGLNSLAGQMDGSAPASLTGAASTSGNLTNKLSGQIGEVKTGSVQLSTAISSVKSSLGGTGSINDRVDTVGATLGNEYTAQTINGEASEALSMVHGSASDLYTAISDSKSAIGGTATTIFGALGDPSGNTTLQSLSAIIGGSATTSLYTQLGLTTSSAPLADQIKGSSTSLQTAITSVATVLGGSGSLASRAASINSGLLTTPGSNAQADVQAINSLLNGLGTGSTIQGRIGAPTLNAEGSNIASIIGGTSTDIASQLGDPGLNTLIGEIGGSSVSVKSALDELSLRLVNNTNYNTSLANVVGSPRRPCSLYSQCYGDFHDRGIGDGMEQVGIGDLLGGSQLSSILGVPARRPEGQHANVVLFLGGSSPTIFGKLNNIDDSLLIVPTQVIASDLYTLRNRIVSTLGATAEGDVNTINAILNGTTMGSTTQDRIGTPMRNSEPSDISTLLGGAYSSLSARIGDPGVNFASITEMIGGNAQDTDGNDVDLVSRLGNSGGTVSIADQISPSATDLQSAITSVSASVLTTPSGVLEADINTLRGQLVDSPDTNAETDVGTVNSALGFSGTSQTRIGSPSVNRAQSSLSVMIGGSEIDIASQLGDPISGTIGISSKIRNNTICNNATLNSTLIDNFNNATSLRDQMNAFVAIMNSGVTIPAGSYNSLADIINAAS